MIIMVRMTWKRFKEYVDNELQLSGVNEDVEIEYIDISLPSEDYEMKIPYIEIDECGIGIHT